jgi:hypothetical protein
MDCIGYAHIKTLPFKDVDNVTATVAAAIMGWFYLGARFINTISTDERILRLALSVLFCAILAIPRQPKNIFKKRLGKVVKCSQK